MVNTDREEFDKQVAVLFGAFPQVYGLSDARKEAYWRGLQSMSLTLFVRVVDRVIGQSGDDEPPSVRRIWAISRDLVAHAPAAIHAHEGTSIRRPESVVMTETSRQANLVLVRYIASFRGPNIEPHVVRRLVETKNKLVKDFEEIMAEAEVSLEEIHASLISAFDRVIKSSAHTQEDENV
jgi:hypothetical protein